MGSRQSLAVPAEEAEMWDWGGQEGDMGGETCRTGGSSLWVVGLCAQTTCDRPGQGSWQLAELGEGLIAIPLCPGKPASSP